MIFNFFFLYLGRVMLNFLNFSLISIPRPKRMQIFKLIVSLFWKQLKILNRELMRPIYLLSRIISFWNGLKIQNYKFVISRKLYVWKHFFIGKNLTCSLESEENNNRLLEDRKTVATATGFWVKFRELSSAGNVL